MDERARHIQHCMYQYSRAIYRSIKDLVDPYVTLREQAEYRKAVLEACEQTMERLARDPQYFAKPERSLFQDIRRYFPITAQAQVAWAVNEGVAAAVAFIEEQIEAGAFDGGVPRCHATTRKGKPCQRTPPPRAGLLPVAPAPGALQSLPKVAAPGHQREVGRPALAPRACAGPHAKRRGPPSISTHLLNYLAGVRLRIARRRGVEPGARLALRVEDPAEDDEVARMQAREL